MGTNREVREVGMGLVTREREAELLSLMKSGQSIIQTFHQEKR